MEPTLFYWFFQPEDIDEEDNLHLDISTGRLRHKWFPTTKATALRYLRNHPDAAGLRAANRSYLLASITMVVEDVTDKYPKIIPEGIGKGSIVLKTPLEATLSRRNRQDLEQLEYYHIGRTDLIFHTESEFSGLQMGLLSDSEVIEMSVMEVTVHDSRREDGSTVPNGVSDLRMGSAAMDSDGNWETCATCGLVADGENVTRMGTCQGHFGRLELPIPVPHILHMGNKKYGNTNRGAPDSPIMTILNHVCHHCSRIRMTDEMIAAMRPSIEQEFTIGGRNYKSFRRIRNMVKSKISSGPCPHCSKVSSELLFFNTRNKGGAFYLDEKSDQYTERGEIAQLAYADVRNILEGIPDEECVFYGMDYQNSRPENLFVKNVPIAPNTARPMMYRYSGEPDDNDLTTLYTSAVYASNKYREEKAKGVIGSRINRYAYDIYLAVSRIYDNQLEYFGSAGTSLRFGYNGSVKKVSKKGIMNRLKGKKGQFRNNLQSKYVESVAYSIISPDSNLAIDEVGVPISACKKVSFPVKVTKDNMKQCFEWIKNRRDGVYPAAKRIYKDGSPSESTMAPKIIDEFDEGDYEYLTDGENFQLEEGMYIERDIIKGDIGLFNRAPSLHRQSVMAFRVVPVPTKSLRMNPTVCIPFNADYDGDAMKFHFVRSEEAKEEAEQLLLLTKNIVHARYGKLTVATDQDQTSGLYLLTHTDKRRVGEWSGDLGFTDEGIPYISKRAVADCYSTVFSEIRSGKQKGEKRYILSLPDSDYTSPDGTPCYTGRAVFNHLFTILDATYVSATFRGNSPRVDDIGNIEYKDGKKQKERVVIIDGKLIQGTLEKDAFGEGGASIAPSFIYHEGYEKGLEKLSEYIELVTRLGFSAHRVIGYTMGVSDVSAPLEVRNEIKERYQQAAQDILEVETAFDEGRIMEYVRLNDPEKLAVADADKIAYLEEKVLEIVDDYENDILRPIEDSQGSGNAMQVAVRSRARGKDENVRQMAGSYGQVRLGENRINYGTSTKRVLPHYPLTVDGKQLPLLHPKHTGFVESGYSKGMEPHEYWFTSTAGIRSTLESGQGNIAKSGYLERKMIKALESCVVNQRRQVVNTRSGRVISPLIGDDGLSPYHIRGQSDVNTDGYVITLQPLLFEFTCKHGNYLVEADGFYQGECVECSKPSDMKTYDSAFSKDTVVSQPTRDALASILLKRQVSKPTIKKMVKKLEAFYEDSLCRVGEAVGATAGSCIGEPATQTALRTFHFAGKLSSQGDIDRLKELLESPANAPKYSPETRIYLLEGDTEEKAKRIQSILTQVSGSQVIDLIRYDLQSSSIIVNFDKEAFETYNLNPYIIYDQIDKTLGNSSLITHQIQNTSKSLELPLVIKIDGGPKQLAYAKEMIMASSYNGIKGVIDIEYIPPNKNPHQRHCLRILSSNDELLKTIVEKLELHVDLDLLETNNHGWVYRNYGLEAALYNVYSEIDLQMNKNGIGEYDMRYIRTIVDLMGEKGELAGLGPNQLSVLDNPSILAAASLERQGQVIPPGAVMGNFDPLNGVTESIVVGKTAKIGNFAPE